MVDEKVIEEGDPLTQEKIIYNLFMKGQHLADSTVREITKGKVSAPSFKRIVSQLIRKGVLIQHTNVKTLNSHYYDYFLPIEFREMGTACENCGKSVWTRDGKCNVCGKERVKI